MVDYKKLSEEGSQLPRSPGRGPRSPLIEATEIATTPVGPKQIEAWQNAIKQAWQKQVSSIIETGRALLDIRSQIISKGEHEDWRKLFEGPNRPFVKRTALMLMEVADNTVLSAAKYTSRLPSCWYTLYILSKGLPLDRLQVLIENGEINPDVTQRHAKDILNREKSRNRRAEMLASEIASEIKGESEPPPPRLFGAPRPKETPKTHLYRLEKQLALLVGGMEPAHDMIWHDSEFRKKLQRHCDRAFRVTDERPAFELTSPDEEVETETAVETEVEVEPVVETAPEVEAVEMAEA